jgi:hypothetical protein
MTDPEHREDPASAGSPDDVTYHGWYQAGGPVIAVEDPDGTAIGMVGHVVKHSPTGMGWGYGGSGPADCARSLLIAALGGPARALLCSGSGKVAYRPDDGEEPQPVTYDPAASPEEYEAARLTVTHCWQWNCDEGYVRLPYQDFKSEHVAAWDRE